MKKVSEYTIIIFVIMLGLINAFRGFAHLLAEDGAAGAAGININNASAIDIVYLFAIIGGVQVILALFYIYTGLFNRKIIHIALIIEVLKTSLNLFIGFVFKPSSAVTVVGSKQDSIQLVLAMIALIVVLLNHFLTKTTYEELN